MISSQISAESAKAVILASTGLLTPYNKKAHKEDVFSTIQLMGVLQIDTINVIARSPYLVLWSRLGNYTPTWLDELLAENKIFEHWSHAASFIPIEDYPLYRRFMLDAERGYWLRSDQWINENQTLVQEMIQTIKQNGPVMAKDFKRKDGKKSLWWDRKIEKITLEHLYNAGQVMIASRKNFHRVYDLRENILNNWQDQSTPPKNIVYQNLVEKAIQSMGIARRVWVPDYFRTPKKETFSAIDQLLQEGKLISIDIQGWESAGLIHHSKTNLLEQAQTGQLLPTLSTLLSPFDPLIWDRKRTREIFDFEFSLECYLPKAKRKYGYFNLPILHNGNIIGRLDPKAHRKEGIMEIKAIHMRQDIKLNDQIALEIALLLKRFAAWHNSYEIKITHPEPTDFINQIEESI
ncbi:MAG: YcaQ family DNA glycosylase [Anaerolineaceae bacterium]|nr:YcaQ family DNA glycosylase [Anaerolineaceae bacterium]